MDTLQLIRQQALQLLSRREYSQRELQQKLAADHPADAIETVLAQLVEQGLQSDTRFAEVWTRHRLNQGYGPIRIQTELRQKGVAADTIQAQLSADTIDWFARAQATWQRKFRGRREREPRLKAKQIRFLQYRGFTSEQIRHALDAPLTDSVESPELPDFSDDGDFEVADQDQPD